MKRDDQYFYSAKTAFYALIAMMMIIISLALTKPVKTKIEVRLTLPDGRVQKTDLSHLIPGKDYIFSYGSDTVKIKEK